MHSLKQQATVKDTQTEFRTSSSIPPARERLHRCGAFASSHDQQRAFLLFFLLSPLDLVAAALVLSRLAAWVAA